MSKAVRAGDAPIKVDLKKGKEYYWCACGKSSKQPFCDGSHLKESEIKPIKFSVDKDKTRPLCTCKQTKTPPFCDGSHRK